jgi:hypothetical protein
MSNGHPVDLLVKVLQRYNLELKTNSVVKRPQLMTAAVSRTLAVIFFKKSVAGSSMMIYPM